MEERNLLKEFSALGNRLSGVSLEFRRRGTTWPKPWRATVHTSKNERGQYRLKAFGDEAGEAIAGLLKAVEEARCA